MSGKKLIVVAIGVVAAIVLAVVVFAANNKQNDKPDAVGSDTSTPSETFVPLPQQTLQGSPNPTTAASAKPAATPSPTESLAPGEVPVVAPTLTPIEFEAGNGGSSESLEKDLTPEEITARETIFKVIPVMANLTSPKYTSPLSARDELVAKGAITENMAKTRFRSAYTAFESDLHKTGFTVQTTGLKCSMRTLSPQTPLQLGKVSCYFTRHYVDGNGAPVSNTAYVKAVGGAGSIDPRQISSVEVSIKQEGGAWKVDDIS